MQMQECTVEYTVCIIFIHYHSSLWILVTQAGQHKDTVAYIYLQLAAADGSPALLSCQFHDGGTKGEKSHGKTKWVVSNNLPDEAENLLLFIQGYEQNWWKGMTVEEKVEKRGYTDFN